MKSGSLGKAVGDNRMVTLMMAEHDLGATDRDANDVLGRTQCTVYAAWTVFANA